VLIEVVVQGKDQASTVLDKVGGSISGLGSIAAGVATGGLALAAAAVVGLGVAAVGATVGVAKLAMAAAEIEGTRKTFETLTEDLGGPVEAMDGLKEATRGMVSQADLMAASNKFLTMGITENLEETEKMAEMATQLGLAMGTDATKSMEDFALMMANQSIPRLDTFGISSAAVRARIEELQAATEGLSREEAFKIAVMEQGAVAMEKVGEQGESAAATTLRWQTAIADLKLSVGQAFVPALEAIREPIMELVDKHGPKVVEWAEIAGAWLGENLPIAIEKLEAGWETIKPGLIWARDIFQLFTETTLPYLKAAWDILRTGFEEVVGVYNTELKPALEKLWEALGLGETKSDDITVAVGKFMGMLAMLAASRTIEMLKSGIEGLASGIEWGIHTFNTIKDAIERVKTAFQNFKDAIAGFQLPWWLSPGSPTPLETGLIGIGRALSDVQSLSGRGLGFGGGNNYSQTTNQSQSFNMNVYTNAGAQAVHQGFQTMAALS
jgi:hypothetical protein